MLRLALALMLLLVPAVPALGMGTQAAAQQTVAASPAPDSNAPLPSTRELLLDVERHQKAAEALQRDYTYHVHVEQQDLAKDGAIRKSGTTDAESLTLDGVRVNRLVARNGKPLNPEETKKENERIDKEVAKARERRTKADNKGQETDTRGDVLIPASRILELGNFSNPRRIDFGGRPTIVLDYAGDPNAHTHGPAEGIIRDLVGTVWIDEHDRVLVRAQGRFINDFKVGGGLLANIHKGLSFDFQAQRVADNVWLPSVVEGQGSARLLLFDGVNGRFRLATSDYRKFRTGATIIASDRVIGPNGQPVSPPAASENPPVEAKPDPGADTAVPSPQPPRPPQLPHL